VSRGVWLERFEKLWENAKEYSTTLSILAAVALVVAAELGVIPPLPRVLFGLLATSALALSLLAIKIHNRTHVLESGSKKVETQLSDLSSRVSSLTSRVDSLLHGMSAELQNVVDAQVDLEGSLSAIKPGEKVVIDHIGLDMSIAWNFTSKLIQKAKGVDLEYRLLMLTDDPDRLGTKPHPEIVEMCATSADSLRKIKAWIQAHQSDLLAPGRACKIEIRRYSEMPWVHGFEVSQPFCRRYVSFFRWKEEEPASLDWGAINYHILPDVPENHSMRDLAEIFDRQFEHLWATASESVLLFPEPTGQ
jgi:hypothetical protein